MRPYKIVFPIQVYFYLKEIFLKIAYSYITNHTSATGYKNIFTALTGVFKAWEIKLVVVVDKIAQTMYQLTAKTIVSTIARSTGLLNL